ncbi:MAG TPA: quinone-dependent dihydroorotate dehydrogenase [Thermopetrobacter sp.]|nr:quinone-dependent dihydroorotate dehydrogenase [Thermopetrobacter sp.]
MSFASLATRFLTTALPPEVSHELALTALEHGLFPQLPQVRDARLHVTAMDLDFPNPLGMAAGFDKDARAFPALLAMGFGHVEVGTLTPHAQAGNPRPRLFRLREDLAIINRMGFNNRGQAAALARIRRWRARGGRGILGVNIGANRTSLDRIADYALGARAMAPVADYLAVNISSPNTPGLRDLQAADELARLLAAVRAAMEEGGVVRPLLVKIAPDLTDADLAVIVETAIAGGAAGLIVSNTTVTRPPDLTSPLAGERGGLSGRPLFEMSTRLLARAHLLAGGRLVLIGAGGVMDGADAWEKIRAGAHLVQLYTGFIWKGPEIVPAILRHLVERMEAEGISAIDAIRGAGAREWAERTPPAHSGG